MGGLTTGCRHKHSSTLQSSTGCFLLWLWIKAHQQPHVLDAAGFTFKKWKSIREMRVDCRERRLSGDLRVNK